MDLKEAISVLKKYNKWRNGYEMKMINPKDITNAINIVIMEIECELPTHAKGDEWVLRSVL
jgi:hypothetical protein